ncbi:MAG: prephenate dehydrogenase [Candidatus Omnitrophica bacterium]|nr:prephenate dehydrogenase [Candidatus Omnitrophota bacterium]
MTFKKITIVGLGLMGGSLAAACRRKFPKAKITAVTRNRQALQRALRKKWIHYGESDLYRGVRDADIIVLCTPVNFFIKTLDVIDCIARKGTLVTDVGSVKAEIQKKLQQRRWTRIRYVSAHPMVGSHEQGFSAASYDLYEEGLTFVIRSRQTPASALRETKNFWQKISAQTAVVTPEEHDRIVAEISHLPHILAVALCLSVRSGSLKFSGTGFKDVSRLAMGASQIWLPILAMNQREIARALTRFESHLREVKKTLVSASQTPSKLNRLLQKAALKRRQI